MSSDQSLLASTSLREMDDSRDAGDDVAIRVCNISKCYQIFDTPRDRLKQFILPRLQRLIGQTPKQYYREFWALKDVTFDVKNGEAIGIIGCNGSGKSTLLQIICGTLTPTKGSIQTNGRIAALLELGSGFNPEFTGRENVYMNGALMGLSKAEIEQRFDAIVDFSDIGDFIDQPVKAYSSGMMVRLAFSVIAHVDADILIVDEALAVGDIFFAQKCMRFLHSFMEKGTLLFVSHDLPTVKYLCDRVIWLDDGEVFLDDSSKRVSEAYLDNFIASQRALDDWGVNSSPTDHKDTNSKTELDFFDTELTFCQSKKVEIVNVSIEIDGCAKRTWFKGGEKVQLEIGVVARAEMQRVIIGFQVNDAKGQSLFGENTYEVYSKNTPSVVRGEYVKAMFDFEMPKLTKGKYTVAVAVATGTQASCSFIEWLHDGLVIQSICEANSFGKVGIPMRRVILEVGRNYA